MNTIKKISKVLNIPFTTLQYWERIGLINVPRGENNYRNYEPPFIVYISELNYYNYLGVASKDLKYLNTGKINDIALMLDKTEKEIAAKIELLKKQRKLIYCEKNVLNNIENYKLLGYRFSKMPFEYLVERADDKTLIADSFKPKNHKKIYFRFKEDYLQSLINNKPLPLKNRIAVYIGKNKNEIKKEWNVLEFKMKTKIIECFAWDSLVPEDDDNYMQIVNDIKSYGFNILNVFLNYICMEHKDFIPVRGYYRCFVEVIGDGKLPEINMRGSNLENNM